MARPVKDSSIGFRVNFSFQFHCRTTVMAVYRNLDDSPKIFGLPSHQVFPWLGITIVVALIFGSVLHLSWYWCLFIDIWFISIYFLLTRRGMHHFFGRLVQTPVWVRGIAQSETVLYREQPINGKDRKTKGNRAKNRQVYKS
jgi:hypothetical protein